MRAKVELDTEPTKEMNRSNLIKTRTREQCAKYCGIFMLNSFGFFIIRQLGTVHICDRLTKVKQIYEPSCLLFHGLNPIYIGSLTLFEAGGITKG